MAQGAPLAYSGPVSLDRPPRYRVLRDLPQVGGSRVMVAQDLWVGGSVVIKAVPSGTAESAALAVEGSRLSDLHHPRLVRYHHRFEAWDGFGDAPSTGLATRWVDGDPLDRAMVDATPNERLRWLADVVSVTAFLHRRGLLHLDLKPANVLANEQGATVLDIGSAQPLDAGPGEAGGTLGWAAPEVLAGGTATEASDAFGIGALLYLILTGARPHAGLEGVALRRAALADAPTAVRAVAPEAPRELARLADRLLAPAPERRPDLGAIAEVLASVGAPVDLDPGEPSFIGRDIEIEALQNALVDGDAPLVAVVGPAGSGRTRLSRRVLDTIDAGAIVDLADATDVSLGLHRVLSGLGQRLPPYGPGWSRTWTPGPKVRGVRTIAFLGARERWRASEADDLSTLLPMLARAGVTVVLASHEPLRGGRNVQVAPLDDDELRRLARAVAAVRPSVADEAARGAAGWPGPLLELLASHADRVAALTPDLRDALSVLSTLPTPLSVDVLASMPAALAAAVPRLAERHLVRLLTDGALTVPHAVAGPLHASVVPLVERALARGQITDPVSRSLALVRLGRPIDAALTYAALCTSSDAAQIASLVEIGEALITAGHDAARLPLGRLYMREQRVDEARAVADLDDPELRAFQAHLLLRQARPTDARVVLGQARARFGDHPSLLIEEARDATTSLDFERAHELIELAAQAGAPEDAVLAIRLVGAFRSPLFGDIDQLVARAEGLPHLEPAVMVAVATALSARGESDTRARWLHRALGAADRSGDTMVAVSARASLGALLSRAGRTGDARSVWVEALGMARAHRVVRQETRLAYNLCELELRAGRLAAAERYATVLDRAAEGVEADSDTLGRVYLLRAQVALAKGDAAQALQLLSPVGDERHRSDRDLLSAKAHLALGDPDAALAAVAQLSSLSPEIARSAKVVAGRAHLAIGRRTLRAVAAEVPDVPDAAQRLEVGEILLAAGGEDILPDDVPVRRDLLARASRMLRGPLARRAEEIRERLLESPAASLNSIAELTDAVHDPPRFPRVLGKVVAEALSANRVLILLKLPGLGQQLNYREITRNEAAGIAHEVLERIRMPNDVWIADDAFADPVLREVSVTVRTFELKSLVAVAIPRGDEAIGALYVDDVHVTARFGPAEVDQLRRLAGAIGRMVGLMPQNRVMPAMTEPRELCGALLSRPDHLDRLDNALRRLRGQKESNLLVTGPTGAGKTWFARQVAVEVLGLDGIVEVVLRKGDIDKLVGMLSGTRKGDYTGAVDQVGAVERAIRENKALFLDEVHSLDDAGQQSLLPLLELPWRRFGGLLGPANRIERPLHVIVATNVDTSPGQWERHFREDFWWRISRVRADLPSLSERGPEVVYRYLQRMLENLGLPAPETVFEPAALHSASVFDWPGNLRELESFASAAGSLYRDIQRQILATDLPTLGMGDPERAATGCPLEDVERRAVLDALKRAHWNQSRAADLLGITKFKLFRRLQRWGMLEEVQARRQEERSAGPGRRDSLDDEGPE